MGYYPAQERDPEGLAKVQENGQAAQARDGTLERALTASIGNLGNATLLGGPATWLNKFCSKAYLSLQNHLSRTQSQWVFGSVRLDFGGLETSLDCYRMGDLEFSIHS